MRSYQEHLLQTTTAAPANRGLRKPVLRSSAIFPAFHGPGLTTRLAFLGYWMIKRRIPEIQVIVTLRSQTGERLARKAECINEARAYRIELTDLLDEAGLWEIGETAFTGSLEIEFHATRDLVYPYPAVVVQYYGSDFGTIVHTAQRVYNDAEDRDANQANDVPEAGFNLYADEHHEPFFTFVNGFEPVRDGRISMQLWNSGGDKLSAEWNTPGLAPYETTVFYPGRHLNLQEFLGNRPGTAKISFDTNWVFPRIIAGNRERESGRLSVTHTYYDCSSQHADGDYWPSAPAGYDPASLYVPLYARGDRYTNLNFYPIYSPAEVAIDARLYDGDGNLLNTIPLLHLISPTAGQDAAYGEGIQAQLSEQGEGSFRTIPLEPLFEGLNVDVHGPLGVNLVARPLPGSRLPSRLKVGIDYGQGDTALPCNICKTMDVCNPVVERKLRSFHWAPLVADQLDAVVWLVNSSPKLSYEREAEVTVTFYREKDTETLARHFIIAPHGVKELRLGEDAELAAFLEAPLGWYTAVSSNPHVKSYYLSESRSGIIGGDHDF